jgi:hypothetical protein
MVLLKIEWSATDNDTVSVVAPKDSFALAAFDALSARLALPLVPANRPGFAFVSDAAVESVRAKLQGWTWQHGTVSCRAVVVVEQAAPEAAAVEKDEELPPTRSADVVVVGRVYGESVLQRVPVRNALFADKLEHSDLLTAADFTRFRLADAVDVLGDAELWTASGSVVIEICKTTPERAARIAEWIVRTPLAADIIARRAAQWGAVLPCVDFLAHSFAPVVEPANALRQRRLADCAAASI